MHIEQALTHHFDLLRIANLGNHDAVRHGLGGGREVVGVPGRVDGVNADEHLARTEAAGLDRVRHLLAGGLLGVGRDRILEIEDDAVGGKRLGLLQRTGIGARHIEHAAAGANGHGSVSVDGFQPSVRAKRVPLPWI